jgi:predicted phage terminase large subunit-like protein
MGYCTDINGIQMHDSFVKELILGDNLEVAHYTVSRFITKRDLQVLHKKIIHNVCTNKNSMDLAPRGFGKSTAGDVDHCITLILRNANIRIMIGSKTQTQAEAFLKEIRAHFEMNEDLIRIFGDLKGTPWNDTEFTVGTRTIIKKEATVTALGASGAVVSKHFDVIMADDLVGFENARTQLQREKLKEWFFSSLYPTLEPDGAIHVLGTRYHPLDLYQGMIDSGTYVIQIQKALNKAGKSLWETKFTTKKLMQIKRDTPITIWNMQYQNDVELAKGTIFKASYFRYYQGYEINEVGDVLVRVKNEETGMESTVPVHVFFGADLAIKEKELSDYFVLMAIGVSQDNDIFVLKYIKERLSFDSQQDAICNMATLFPFVGRIGIETVGYQYALYQMLEKNSTLPVSEINTSKDKVVRAQRRSVLFENGKVHFLSDMQDLEENLLLFPDDEHDDLFDGLDFAITASEESHANVLDYMAQEYAKAQADEFRQAEAARKAHLN